MHKPLFAAERHIYSFFLLKLNEDKLFYEQFNFNPLVLCVQKGEKSAGVIKIYETYRYNGDIYLFFFALGCCCKVASRN